MEAYQNCIAPYYTFAFNPDSSLNQLLDKSTLKPC